MRQEYNSSSREPLSNTGKKLVQAEVSELVSNLQSERERCDLDNNYYVYSPPPPPAVCNAVTVEYVTRIVV